MAGEEKRIEVTEVRIEWSDDYSFPLVEAWLLGGQYLHRRGGPAVIERSEETGAIIHEAWHLHNRLSRLEGPAKIERDEETGIITHEKWALNDLAHRMDGPAIIERDGATGAVIKQEWWQNGKRISAGPPPELEF